MIYEKARGNKDGFQAYLVERDKNLKNKKPLMYWKAAQIILVVAKYFQIEPEEITKKRRFQRIVYPRQVSMFFIRKYTNLVLAEIGELFDTDHTTVIHSIDKIRGLKDVYNLTKRELSEMQEIIKNIKMPEDNKVPVAKFGSPYVFPGLM